MSGEHDEEIARLYLQERLDTKAISDEIGISPRSVCRALVRHGAREQQPKPPRPTLTQQMIDLLEDGASYADVAETFGVGSKWLRDAAPGYGWDGKISGSIAHMLRKPEVRAIFHEIRRMPIT